MQERREQRTVPRKGNGGVWQRTSNCKALYDSSEIKYGAVYCESISKRGSSGLCGDLKMLEENLHGILFTLSLAVSFSLLNRRNIGAPVGHGEKKKKALLTVYYTSM